MKKIRGLYFIFSLTIVLCSASQALANNLSISNYGPNGRNVSTKTVKLRFSLNWDNSWRTAQNHDAVWLFVKFYDGSIWRHATMLSSGFNPEGTTKSAGCPYDIVVPADKKGFFIRRSESNVGCCTTAPSGDCDFFEVTWAYGEDQIIFNTVLDFPSVITRLFGMEMVYVPQASFYLGSGSTESGSFTDGSWSSGSTIPFLISSENMLEISPVSGKLWGTSATGSNSIGDQGNLSDLFPKGYKSFYVMKYSITQGQYKDFLNTLTRNQQNLRTATNIAPGVTSVANRYVMSNTSTMQNRNSIRCNSSIHTSNPVTFYCDYNGNGVGNEAGDGPWIAANYLSWADLAAFLDWAALRPFTEMEFEKMSRGTILPVLGEYAWGTNSIASAAYSLSSAGQATENISANYSTVSGNALYTTTKFTPNGPCRVGIFAAHINNTGRITAGASHYGIMELSGNLWERTISVGHSFGRSFSGLHGNGILDSSGNANISNWPGTDAAGVGQRGGSWDAGSTNLRVSDRTNAAAIVNTRASNLGGRGARTAP